MALPTAQDIYYKIGLALKADDVPENIIFELNINDQIDDAKKWFYAVRKIQLNQTTVKEVLDENNSDFIFCKYFPFPVQEDAETDDEYYARVITSMSIDGTNITVNSTNLHLDSDTGKIILKSDGDAEKSAFTVSENYPSIKITHLYQDETTPDIELAITLTASILAVAAFVGSTHDEVTSATIADISFGVGEPYMNIKACGAELKEILKDVMEKISYKVIIG